LPLQRIRRLAIFPAAPRRRSLGYDAPVRTADFDYELPERLVAQTARPRGTSRLLVLDRRDGAPRCDRVARLPAHLVPGDLMLVNDVRVIPARLRAEREDGKPAELLLVRPAGDGCWEALARPARRLRPGVALALREGRAIPREPLGEGRWLVDFDPPLDAAALERAGETPLPPYIRREHGATVADRRRYQTVYAAAGRAVAAPTAGLHFTPELLAALAERGVERAAITLHVGPGTFRPVQADDPREHRLDAEDYEVPADTAVAVNRARAAGRRIVCVGTTACRALEHGLAAGRGRLRAGAARADLLILPGYRFRGTGALLTNFHLPRSSLLMLVSALAGRARVLAAYRLAVAEQFSFYSYGDAMLVL
jgi:S-adenosylmethionine:tRNA ribosyltransferase-isomerase